MKKTLQDRDRHFSKVIRRRENRQRATKQKRSYKKRGFDKAGSALAIRIAFPQTIGIQNKKSRIALTNCIDLMKRNIGKRPVLLDFSKVSFQYPSAILLLAAELDNMKRVKSTAFNVEIILPTNQISRQVLHQVGIAQLCGKEDSVSSEEYDESVKHWKYATGTWMNDVPGKALERFEGQLPEELHSGMWKGVSEAIINSVQHAYIDSRGDGFADTDETRWWMLSQVRDGELTVAVCDLGIGIPRSLPLRWGESRIAGLLAKFGLANPEVAAIRAALEIGATRTGEENRGRGLPQIWEDMKAHDGAGILLLSNRALLHWGSKTKVETAIEYDRSIFGTLVMWTVPLSTGGVA